MMNIRKIIMAPLLGLFINAGAQHNDSIRYIVTEARINKLDYSNDYFDQGQYLAFYSKKNGESGFLNSTADHTEYSYGQILNMKRMKMEEDGCKGETIYFRWKYRNSYDKETGYAFVQLKRLYRENGVEFLIKIVSNKLEMIEFSGFTNERKYKNHTLRNSMVTSIIFIY